MRRNNRDRWSWILVIGILFALFSCDYIKQDEGRIPIARVNDSYLYLDEIEDLVFETTSPEDSAVIVGGYINRWATRQLLIDQAMINLSEQQQQQFDELVEDYRSELYTDAYKSMIVSRELDSTISESELNQYYEQNKANFRLNESLIKVRYVHLDPNYSDEEAVRQRLVRFDSADRSELSELSIQFMSYNFNDSTWFRQEALVETLPVLSDRLEVLKKSNFTLLQDSIGLYLVKIEDALAPNDPAPMSYVRPTIIQVILNKRKLELIKKLEKDITKDAINSNRFETYFPQ
ncbi:peptidyl-prolyl cis-trans isomerase [Aureitalea marina]|uniref:Peptidylprolyl isomerase n=1 Tax=Aureitalea marina TaxID=930804 RepID=A0A2S7KMX1_9FLAO|nr:peptidylprolyl isomerase [Aureitalea marina]PQB03948.1 peptidylprolyl isomerase [Aureitalea marina]